MAPDLEKNLIEKLKGNNSSEVYSALLKVRKFYTRNQCKMKKLQKYSIVEIIIPLLEHPKYCSISLSIIADGCLELSFVREVIKYNGIQSLMRIMKSLVNDDVQNRACRALGNLAKFDVGFKSIHTMKPVSRIINFLTETSNVNCQQTAVRTLMILGRNPKARECIVNENGVIHIAKLLHSPNVNLLICSIKAVANLTRNCSIFCARQLIELQLHEVILELNSHSEKSIRNHALISLKNLSMQEEIRSDLVKVGAVKLFTEILSELDSHEMSRLAALALCNCLDHIHMWSHNGTDRAVGLKALLDVLQSKKFQDIHLHVISSLIPLSYESKVTDILLNLDVLQILIEILNIFIEKYKCKLKNSSLKSNFRCESDDLLLDQTRYEAAEFEAYSSVQIDSHLSKEENRNRFFDGTILKSSMLYEKSDNFYPSEIGNRWDNSFYSVSPTSDYSSCSPTRMSVNSEHSKKTPDVYYEIDLPSSGHVKRVLYPVPHVREMIPQVTGWSPVVSYVTCWSPVVSSRSNSPTPDYGILDNLCFEELSQFPPSPTNDIFHPLNSDYNLAGIDTSSHMSSNSLMLPKSNLENENLTQNFQSESDINENTHITEALDSKMKIEIIRDEYSECGDQSLADSNISSNTVKTSDFDAPYFSDEIRSLNSNEISEKHTIDHYVLLFILQLSFHLEKKPNSQVADKTCFSVLIDYLCLIHNPSPKAETILLNLIKNRYCFEKLIVSGFISEMEEKMVSSNYSCIHRSDAKVIYLNLIDLGRQEVESDFGIGTLSHILATSEKVGQLHAICAMSKLITDKSALYRLLFQANGLSLLCNFLSDNCITTRRKAIISLCELYQSLTKDEKKEDCCFLGTCGMKTSVKCFYKISYHDVSFIVNSGIVILANREKLCENSDYFSALLDGHFLESSVKTVSLPEISAENLSTIFHFLHGCGSGYCCPYIKRIPFAVLLELLCYCDRYLLNNIKANVEDRLCHCLFPSTVSKIYRESKIHNSPALSKRSLNFALKINTVQRDILWSCFEELINLESNFNFLGDIQTLLKSMF